MDEEPLVMLVEDDSGVREVMQAVIEHEHYRVVLAEGTTAAATAQCLQPDVILLDIHMPRVDGTAVYHALKEHPATHAIPVVLVSAVYDLPTVARRLGATAYLMKPFPLDMLKDKIDPLIAARRAHSAEHSQGGPS